MGNYTNQDCLRELEKANIAKTNIKIAIENKGVEVPEGTPLSDYAEKISQISGGGGEMQEIIVYPETQDADYTPTEGYDGISKVTVKGVTPEIDEHIQPENIKEGVVILGVEGTLHEGITPEGTIVIDSNGTYDVTNYESAEVNVQGGGAPDYRYMDGTVDHKSLASIGWTEEDILRFEQNSPHYSWQDVDFVVSDENKALFDLDDPRPDLYKDDPRVTFVPNKHMEDYFGRKSGFGGCKYIKGIPFYDTSTKTDMNRLFNECNQLLTIPLLDTSNATDVRYMFYECKSLLNIPLIDLRSAERTQEMFYLCQSLVTIPLLDTHNVTNMRYMFRGCTSLKVIPQLDTQNATDMYGMFLNCTSLQSVPELNMSNVLYCDSMFNACKALQTVPSLDTSKATTLRDIFSSTDVLTTVEGIDFSGFTSPVTYLFGYTSSKPMVTHFIVNGKINVSIADNYSIKALTKLDYDSVKSILLAASKSDNTDAKTLAFNRTMSDPDGTLQNIITICAAKGWTITGLTLN